MEEAVGQVWHNWLQRKTSSTYTNAQVCLNDIQPRLKLYFHALGNNTKAILPSTEQTIAHNQSWWQKIAGNKSTFSLAWQDESSLYLPANMAVFPEKSLNELLYFWLAFLASQQVERFTNWALDNQNLVAKLLASYPAMHGKYQTLAQSYIKLRQQQLQQVKLSSAQMALEKAVEQAILTPQKRVVFPQVNAIPQPVLLWLYPLKPDVKQVSADFCEVQPTAQKTISKTAKAVKKKAERLAKENNRDGLMVFRLENLFSWSEFAHLDRSEDDSEDDDAGKTADDLDHITLAHQQNQTKSASIKLDLDLPSSVEDDIPLCEGFLLPEWNFKTKQLQADHCLLQPVLPKNSTPCKLPVRLQRLANQLKNQFMQWRSNKYWLKRQFQGEELDLAAVVDYWVESTISSTPEQGLFQSFKGHQRDLSCLLLADISMSTDAYISDQQRVIDVVKDTMMLFSEALQALGDNFALYGFSSVKRHQVRFSMLKNFNQTYNDEVRGRIAALSPGFYTRMGAAIRQSTKVLLGQQTRERILLILTDGKPNDIDHYEGQYGLEDCKQAVLEARKQGVTPFCVTIDKEAVSYLPDIFGQNSYTLICDPKQMPLKLASVYHQLTAKKEIT